MINHTPRYVSLKHFRQMCDLRSRNTTNETSLNFPKSKQSEKLIFSILQRLQGGRTCLTSVSNHDFHF
ncbi:hypothetical protein X975_14183, partial [Stegodyphus mimosarum]